MSSSPTFEITIIFQSLNVYQDPELPSLDNSLVSVGMISHPQMEIPSLLNMVATVLSRCKEMAGSTRTMMEYTAVEYLLSMDKQRMSMLESICVKVSNQNYAILHCMKTTNLLNAQTSAKVAPTCAMLEF